MFFGSFTDIERSDKDFIVPRDQYVDVLCFLTFNFCAMIGSLLTSWIQWVCRIEFDFLILFLLSFSVFILAQKGILVHTSTVACGIYSIVFIL